VNQRIRQLAEQAGYEKDMFGIGHWDMPECKKFAELIVRECATIAYQWQDEYGIIDDYYTPPTIDNVIKEHFGVEE